MLNVAQWCATAGWPVHPLAPGRKTPAGNCSACQGASHRPHQCPCIPQGHWCHGFHAATTEPGRIDSWWSQNPQFGVGVSCGPAGLVVIDIDAHPGDLPARDRILPGIPVPASVDLAGMENGFHTLAVLAALSGRPSPAEDENTLRVRTPSGGLHVWYQGGAGRTWLCSAGNSSGRALAWQVDVRGTGGYIVAPGTTTAQGTYTPLGTCHTPAPLPDWLVAELTRTGHTPAPETSSGPRHTAVPSRAREVVVAAGGGRGAAQSALTTVLAEVIGCAAGAEGMGFADKLNKAAYTVGGLVAAGHLSEPAAHQALQDAARHARPHKQHVAENIITSGLTAGARRPLDPGARP